MGFIVSDFGKDILEDVKRVCKDRLVSECASSDRSGEFPDELYEYTSSLGWSALALPEVAGGLPITEGDRCSILREIGRADAGFGTSYMVNSTACNPVFKYGSIPAKKLATDSLSGGGFGAFCLTEAEAGSDIRAMRARAAASGGGDFRLSGTKVYVTNGVPAGFFLVFANAVIDGNDEGITAFLVDGSSDGITRGVSEDKLGLKNSWTCEIDFDDVFVPRDMVIGEIGKGAGIAKETLRYGRVWLAAVALGIADRALEETKARLNERNQFGKPLASLDVIKTKVAEMGLKIAGAEGAASAAIGEMEEGSLTELSASLAKVSASEAALFTAEEAVQLFGGYGYSKEYPVEKLMRDAKVFCIFEGTNEIQRLIIGKELLK